MSTTTDTTDLTAAIDRYFEGWNETDPHRRLHVVAQAWDGQGRYVDPLADVSGHQGISDMIGAVHQQFPGITVRRTSELDHHHDLVHFSWEIVGEDDAPVIGGIDVVQLGDDGRLRDVRGFFVPASA